MGKHELQTAPWQILGYRADGRPVRTIAGGRQADPAAPPASTGDPASLVIPVTPPPPLPAPAQQTQTFDPAAERERIRQELQAEFERQRQEQEAAFNARLGPIEQERREREEAAAEAERQRQEAERQRLAAEETAAQRMERFQQETQQTVANLQSELEKRDAVLEREQRLNQLAEYTRTKVEEAGDSIMPHLREWIRGNSEADIDAAVSRAVATSASIVQDTQAALAAQAGYQQVQYQSQPGVTPTAPAMGPLEGNGAGAMENLTAQQIRDMPLEDYASRRPQLLSWTSRARQQQSQY